MDEEYPYADVIAPYGWIVILGSVAGLLYAVAMGANGVSNSIATTVASSTPALLRLPLVMLLAAVCEFLGATIVYPKVTNTIRSKIVDVKLYRDEPDTLLLGLLTSLVSATLVLLAATRLELPQSTTHTIVAAFMGFALATKGQSAVQEDIVAKIWISWASSTGLSLLYAFVFYGLLRLILFRPGPSNVDQYQRTYAVFPVIVALGMGLNMWNLLRILRLYRVELTTIAALVVSIAVGVVSGLVWFVVLGPMVKRRAEATFEQDAAIEAEQQVVVVEQPTESPINEMDESESPTDAMPSSKPTNLYTAQVYNDATDAEPITHSVFSEGANELHEVNADDVEVGRQQVNGHTAGTLVITTTNVPVDADSSNAESPYGLHQRHCRPASSSSSSSGNLLIDNTFGQDLKAAALSENARAQTIWEKGVVHDARAEQPFAYLLVVTAAVMAFVHGANDVANALGPVSALIEIWQIKGEVESKSTVEEWMALYIGTGIALGILVYGYRVTKSLGYKITIMSPSRGVCAQLAASFYVCSAVHWNIPISSTHAICGAVVGVGLVEGFSNVQWFFVGRYILGWIGTFILTSWVSSLVFLALKPLL